jgi:hypothetical protein
MVCGRSCDASEWCPMRLLEVRFHEISKKIMPSFGGITMELDMYIINCMSPDTIENIKLIDLQ